jgi:tRNA (guanine-N7-)-methyltransferase
MSRLRGPAIALPEGEEAWPLLNEKIYGSPTAGGPSASPVEELVARWDWAEAFGRNAPLMLEVGFNRGKFLTGLAERFPEHNVVGIEIRRKFVGRLAQLTASKGSPENLRVIWGDAKELMATIFGPASLDAMFVTFPDPWWKRRHAKRRLVDTRFAEELAERVQVGGRVWVKTDVEMIADEIRSALIARPEFGEAHTFERDELPLTHRETTCVKYGLPVHRFYVERLDVPFAGRIESLYEEEERSRDEAARLAREEHEAEMAQESKT